jgi:hypothetical protein
MRDLFGGEIITFDAEKDGHSCNGIQCKIVTYDEGIVYDWYILHNWRYMQGGTPDEMFGYSYAWHCTGEIGFDKILFSFIILHRASFKGNLKISNRLYYTLQGKEIFVRVNKKDGYARIKLDDYKDENRFILNIKVGAKDPNCFDLRKGEISYYNGLQPVTEDGKWAREGRQIMKPGKFLSLIARYIEISDTDLMNRAIELISESIKVNNIEDVKISDDPYSIYSTGTTTSSCGTLGKSCMRPEGIHTKQEYLKFYNYVGAKIVYRLDQNGKLSCRALLWDDVKELNGSKFGFVDRIYGTEADMEAIKEWAIENGYGYKRRQVYDDPTIILEGRQITKYDYKLKESIFDKLLHSPFLDSLYHLSNSGKNISSYKGDLILRNTNGEISGLSVYICCTCGKEHLKKDDVVIDDAYRLCKDCAVFSKTLNIWLDKKKAVFEDGDWVRVVTKKPISLINADIILNMKMNPFFIQDPEIQPHAFQIGDRVQILNNHDGGQFELGSIGEIVDYDGHQWLVSQDRLRDRWYSGNGDIRLVPRPPEAEF